jgi:hypothetical protein
MGEAKTGKFGQFPSRSSMWPAKSAYPGVKFESSMSASAHHALEERCVAPQCVRHLAPA